MRVQLDGGAVRFERKGREFDSLHPRHVPVVKRRSHDFAEVGVQVRFLAGALMPTMLVR
jgi:hypothetical protein